jgi:hypothetical protein
MTLFVQILAVFLTIAFFVAVAIFQPGIFGTLAFFLIAGIIFLIGAGFALVTELSSARFDSHWEN